ncbi:MAG: outer membrane beta-barrel protein [Woeseiaceae bacterium]|nr:outer membrane beta-barrel protein [Woeseiaceae bacterium]
MKYAKLMSIALLAGYPALGSAQDESWLWAELKDAPWYGSFQSGYLLSDSDASFIGTTQSVYGGTPTIELDDGLSFSFAVGKQVFDNWRLSLEMGYISIQPDDSAMLGLDLRNEDVFRLDGDIESFTLMANLGYDFNDLDWWVTPFIKGGIGASYNKASTPLSVEYNSAIWQGTSFEGQALDDYSFPPNNTTEFAWSASIGFKRAMAERLSLRFEYGWLNLGDASSGVDSSNDAIVYDDLGSQQFSLGIDYDFE